MAEMGYTYNPIRTANRNANLALVEFDTANTAAPDGLVDPNNVVYSLAHTNTGILTVTLTKRWRKVAAFVSINDATATVIAKVTSVVQGTAADNAVVIQTETSGSAADTNDKHVHLLLFLQR